MRAEARAMGTVGAVLAFIALVFLGWLAGESHYRSCVARAEAITADIRSVPSVQQQLGGAAVPNNRECINAVSGCSRLPF